ncbi:MAG: dihydrolipoamide acetyltransferase family protein [Rubrivivax sp.]|nr:dihydrolipoamide acetyltransferase family protein [Rubrivivax sp.]
MASTRVIKVPDVGEGIAEVELVAWHVKAGDVVAEDQALADVMTDKASVEIPSPVAGRVLVLGGEVGKMLAVGAELIRIETAEAGPARRAAAPVAASASASASAFASASSPMAHLPPAAPVVSRANAPAAAPAAAADAPPPVAGHAARSRPIASPALRRRAWELGVPLQDVVATGTAGRTVQADLDAHVAVHGAPGHAAAPPRAPLHAERHDEEAVPVIGLRRRIALQMQESKRRIPHFSYVEEVDVTELENTRAALNARHAADRGRLTLLPLLMRALVGAVREFPQVNARFDDEAGVVTRHGAVHIGVATDTRHGLMVPVLRHAEARDVWALAAELARLAEAARSGRATRAELSGSTITLSSLGALGGIVSTPVINRPEVAIVAVNRIVERPVARGGAVVLRQVMNLSSSFDHRVVDGIDGARFVQALRARLEAPALLFAD